MPPVARKLMLTAHVVASVGWLGAVLVFLGLGILAMTSPAEATVRAVYVVLEPAAWAVLVPLAAASLLTGVVQSLGTVWGLFRHYWVLFKLVINLGALVVLFLYTETLGSLARAAASSGDHAHLLRGPSVAIHSSLALILLVVATVLAVYKPRGRVRLQQ